MESAAQTILAGDERLELRAFGPSPAQAPTLVFLHEGLGCVATWRDFPAQLAEATGCGALVYSRKGYGNSQPVSLPRPIDYMQDEGLISLPALLAATQVKDAILIGHSDGGSIALVYAGSHRETPRLRGLVLEAPHVFCEEISVRSIEKARQNYREGDLRERLRRHHRDNVDCAFWGWNDAWLDPRFRDWNIESFLPKIRAPILVLQGQDDPYGTSRQVEAIAQGSGGRVETRMLRDCGHTPHRERPQETLTAMTDFVRDLLR